MPDRAINANPLGPPRDPAVRTEPTDPPSRVNIGKLIRSQNLLELVGLVDEFAVHILRDSGTGPNSCYPRHCCKGLHLWRLFGGPVELLQKVVHLHDVRIRPYITQGYRAEHIEAALLSVLHLD